MMERVNRGYFIADDPEFDTCLRIAVLRREHLNAVEVRKEQIQRAHRRLLRKKKNLRRKIYRSQLKTLL